jgi:hypothetical protein
VQPVKPIYYSKSLCLPTWALLLEYSDRNELVVSNPPVWKTPHNRDKAQKVERLIRAVYEKKLPLP